MTDFGILGTFISTFIQSIDGGYTAIQPSVNFLVAALITIVISLTALLTWAFGDFESTIKGLIGRILLIGFIILLVQHWQSYTDDIGTGLTQLGLKAGGSSTSASAFLADPVTIAESGFQLCQQICSQADAVPSGVTGLKNLPDKLIYGLAAVGVFLAYLVIALQVLVAYLEFKIINLAALVFVPFAIWPKTEFLSQRSLSYMFSAGIKLFVLALIVSIGISFTTKMVVSTDPNLENALAVLTGSVMLMTLALSAPSLAQALITGSPQLSAADAKSGAGAVKSPTVDRAKGLADNIAARVDQSRQDEKSKGMEQMKRAAAAGGSDANNNSLAQMARAASAVGVSTSNSSPRSGAG